MDSKTMEYLEERGREARKLHTEIEELRRRLGYVKTGSKFVVGVYPGPSDYRGLTDCGDEVKDAIKESVVLILEKQLSWMEKQFSEL